MSTRYEPWLDSPREENDRPFVVVLNYDDGEQHQSASVQFRTAVAAERFRAAVDGGNVIAEVEYRP